MNKIKIKDVKEERLYYTIEQLNNMGYTVEDELTEIQAVNPENPQRSGYYWVPCDMVTVFEEEFQKAKKKKSFL